MLDYTLVKSELNSYDQKISYLQDALDIKNKLSRKQELEQIIQEPDFWSDQERAIELQTELNRISSSLNEFGNLKSNYEDLYAFLELCQEENDSELDQELETAISKFSQEYENIYMQTLFTGEYDFNNAYLSLQAGAGGTEAMDWVQMLFRMYQRYAEKQGFEFKVNNLIQGEEAGIKSVDFYIAGDYAYGNLKSEMGVHRLVRISPFDASGRRHTSFASMEVVPELDENVDVEINPDDLRIDTYRASGAGGQHVNKTSSAVRITHLPTGIVTASQAERSQFQNKDMAMRQLKSKLLARAEQLNKEKIEDLKGEQMDIAWGSQIRSYVFQPYTMVKDHRTNYEVSDVGAVMDGDIQGFINAYLAEEKLKDYN